MLIWIFGFVVGFFSALLIAGMSDAAERGDHRQEVIDAYELGLRNGMAKPGETLGET